MYNQFKKLITYSPEKRKVKMEHLLKSLRLQEVIESDQVYNTMLKVDRADFIDIDPYYDR
jgi:hypothetical protein